jgi:hypothetical protein
LAQLYIVTTAKRDENIQKVVRKISEDRKASGKFSVDILFWDDVVQDLTRDPNEFFKHYPQLRPDGGKGGDATGAGGAGGGAAGGGDGGNADGSGGAGGGGSGAPWGGGGGGGGGEGGVGGAAGIGGGGGGGGKGAPGGSGGPGTIVISYKPIENAPPPQSLYQIYQRNAYAPGFVGRGCATVETANGPVEIEANLSWGEDCGPTTLWLYIPSTEHVFDIGEAIVGAYPKILDHLDMQTKLPLKSGCKSVPVSPPTFRFSGKMHIYSETPLAPNKLLALKEKYTRENVSLAFHSTEHFSQEQVQDRSAEAPHAAQEIVIMMVGSQ